MHRTLALAVCFVLTVGSIAHAQTAAWDPPTHAGFTEPARSGGGVELGFWTANRNETFFDASASVVNGLLRGAVVIDNLIEVGLVAGWGWGRLDLDFGIFGGSTTEAATAADPLVYGGVVLGDQQWRLRVGGGIALPAAPSEGNATSVAYYSAATHGLGELWLWAPQRLSIVAYAIVEAVPVEYLYIEGALRPAVLIPVESDTSAVPGDNAGDADFVVDASIAVGFRHDFVLAGVRVRGVFLPTIDDSLDQAQTSMEIFLRGTFPVEQIEGLMAFGEWRLVMNLDDDLGFAFDQLDCPTANACGGVWGMFFAFGVGRPLTP
jgi:hypothetical protein